jgi:hypothetical protein
MISAELTEAKLVVPRRPNQAVVDQEVGELAGILLHD